jgi:hypothetical protein
MHRRAAEDTPSYVADAVASAQINGRELAASFGLVTLVLLAMTLIEAPILFQDGPTQLTEDKRIISPDGSSSICTTARSLMEQVATEPSSEPAGGSASRRLLSRAPDMPATAQAMRRAI